MGKRQTLILLNLTYCGAAQELLYTWYMQHVCLTMPVMGLKERAGLARPFSLQA